MTRIGWLLGPLLGLAVTLPGCRTSNVMALELVLSESGCTQQDYDELHVLSLEVYGTDTGDLCKLGQDCTFFTDDARPQNVLDLSASLRDATQPIVDVELEDQSWVAVIGHRAGCFDYSDQVLCGMTEVDDARNRVLQIQLQCGPCDTRDIPFCP